MMHWVTAGVVVGAGTLLAAQGLIVAQERLQPTDIARNGAYANVDGIDLYYESWGSGPPIVLVHGFASSTFCWRRVVPELAQNHRVLAVDLPGYGASARPNAPIYATDRLAMLLAGVLDHAGLSRVDMVGHSFGGRVALQLALAQPWRVGRLALLAPEVYATTRPPITAALRVPLLGPAIVAATLSNRWAIGPGLRMACANKAVVDEEMVAGYRRPLRVRGTVAAQIAQARSPKDGPDGRVPGEIGELAAQTLLLWGADDPIFPLALGRRLVKDLPAARLMVLPHTGHLPHEERGDEVGGLLQDYFTL